MKFGLKDKDLQEIIKIIGDCEHVKSAKIFGSRAMDNYKPGSDVDLAIFGSDVTLDDVLQINSMLNEETLMPYMFDVLHYEKLDNKELQKHIDEKGLTIFVSGSIKKNKIN